MWPVTILRWREFLKLENLWATILSRGMRFCHSRYFFSISTRLLEIPSDWPTRQFQLNATFLFRVTYIHKLQNLHMYALLSSQLDYIYRYRDSDAILPPVDRQSKLFQVPRSNNRVCHLRKLNVVQVSLREWRKVTFKCIGSKTK